MITFPMFTAANAMRALDNLLVNNSWGVTNAAQLKLLSFYERHKDVRLAGAEGFAGFSPELLEEIIHKAGHSEVKIKKPWPPNSVGFFGIQDASWSWLKPGSDTYRGHDIRILDKYQGFRLTTYDHGIYAWNFESISDKPVLKIPAMDGSCIYIVQTKRVPLDTFEVHDMLQEVLAKTDELPIGNYHSFKGVRLPNVKATVEQSVDWIKGLIINSSSFKGSVQSADFKTSFKMDKNGGYVHEEIAMVGVMGIPVSDIVIDGPFSIGWCHNNMFRFFAHIDDSDWTIANS